MLSPCLLTIIGGMVDYRLVHFSGGKMQEDSSNPPVAMSQTTVSCVPPSCMPDSIPPSREIVMRDHTLRDVLVNLCKPCRVSSINNPKAALIEAVHNNLKARKNEVPMDQLEEVISIIMERDLVHFVPEKSCYYATEKAGEILSELYIVICDNCRASNVRPEETDEIKSLMFCHRCGLVI